MTFEETLEAVIRRVVPEEVRAALDDLTSADPLLRAAAPHNGPGSYHGHGRGGPSSVDAALDEMERPRPGGRGR
jgi:hypothetical protein